MHIQHLPLLLGQEGGPVIPPLKVPMKNAVFIFPLPGMGKVLITMFYKLFSVSSIVYASIISNKVISEMLHLVTLHPETHGHLNPLLLQLYHDALLTGVPQS